MRAIVSDNARNVVKVLEDGKWSGNKMHGPHATAGSERRGVCSAQHKDLMAIARKNVGHFKHSQLENCTFLYCYCKDIIFFV